MRSFGNSCLVKVGHSNRNGLRDGSNISVIMAQRCFPSNAGSKLSHDNSRRFRDLFSVIDFGRIHLRGSI